MVCGVQCAIASSQFTKLDPPAYCVSTITDDVIVAALVAVVAADTDHGSARTALSSSGFAFFAGDEEDADEEDEDEEDEHEEDEEEDEDEDESSAVLSLLPCAA